MNRPLEIVGHNGIPVPRTFIPAGENVKRVAILLPGFGYTCDMPLFYYGEQLLFGAGYDVVRVDARYSENAELRALDTTERINWIDADVAAVIASALAHRDYEELLIVAKSATTAALANLFSRELPEVPSLKIVWLTPVLGLPDQPGKIAAIDATGLLVIGTADHHYDPALAEQLLAPGRLTPCIIDGGDHSLDIAGDVPGSVMALGATLDAIRLFLER